MQSKWVALKEKSQITKFIFWGVLILCFTPLVSTPLALVLGIVVSLFFYESDIKQTQKYTHILLKVAVVGLGFGIPLQTALEAGKQGFMMTSISITAVLSVGFILAKAFKLDRKMSYLISTGTAICGGSAIAAISPITKADSKQVSVALAVVFLLNAIALLLFPMIGHSLGLSQHQFGLWAAIAIHDTSSVVGAASKYGSEALELATTVKLARALYIIPVSLFTALFIKGNKQAIKIPWFIALFVAAMLAHSYLPSFDSIFTVLAWLSKRLLAVVLFLIGASIRFNHLKEIGSKPLIFAVLLWIGISVSSLFLILHNGF